MNNLAAETERGSQPIKRRLIMTRRKTYQQGSVRMHNGSWTLRFREFDHTSGKWATRRKVLGKFKTKTDALKASAPIMAQVNERNNMEPQKLYINLTFKEYIETHWKAYTVTEKHQPSTLDLRNSLIKIHLLPFFGKMKLREVQPTHISDFLGKRQSKYTGSTMRALYSLIRLLFEIAEQYDLIDKSPVRPKRHRPKLAKIHKPTLNTMQIQQVLASLPDEQERLFVLLLSVTGIRVREGMALRWMDIESAHCQLSINHTLYKGNSRNPRQKPVPIN
jgi:integrase